MAYSALGAVVVSFLAGFATVIGAGIAILFSRHMKPLTFAMALAFAAGCTLTVAFADVLPEGQEAWGAALAPSAKDVSFLPKVRPVFTRRLADSELESDDADKYSALGLFVMLAGWVVASGFDKILHISLDAYDRKFHHDQSGQHVCAHAPGHAHGHRHGHGHNHVHHDHVHHDHVHHDHAHHDHDHHESCGSDEHVLVITQGSGGDDAAPDSSTVHDVNGLSVYDLEQEDRDEEKKGWLRRLGRAVLGTSSISASEQRALDEEFTRDSKRITRLGYFTACVLALHNIPEGIALYGTATVDSKAGIGLAVAISLHNLPQGMAIAVPIYIGLNSTVKALGFALAAGLAQPLGGIIGYGIVGTDPSDKVMSVMLLLTAGVLFNASLRELFASAIRYDKGNQVVGAFMFLGMLVMAATLVVLAYV